MDDGAIPLTRANFTKFVVDEGDLVTITTRSGISTMQRATPMVDFIKEWRAAGKFIADWEDAHRPAEVTALRGKAPARHPD